MAQDTQVQLAVDGTGKKIRTREVAVTQPDGTTALVEQQVITLAHSDGTLFDADDARARLLSDVAALTTDPMRTGSYPFLARAFGRDSVGQR